MRELISRDIFFGNPDIAGGKLSPDGSRVSFLKEANGVINLFVKDFDAPFEDAIQLTNNPTPLLGYFWTADSKYILYVNDKAGDENINVYRVNPAKVDSDFTAVNLTPFTEVAARIYKVSRQNANKLWIGINDRDKAWHDLYSLDIAENKLTMLYENTERITGWEFDWDEEIRIAYRTDENGFSEILKVNGFDNFTLIHTSNLQEYSSIAGWRKDNKAAYLVTNKGDINFATLFELDLESNEHTLIESDPINKVDIDDVFIHFHTREIICTSYVDERKRRYWKNSEWEGMYSFLSQKFPGREVSISSTTDDYKQMLVAVTGDAYGTEVYYFDWENWELIHQYTPRKALNEVEERLSFMHPVSYPSSDGLTIPAYLTLPRSAEEHKNLPCILFVHGGPKGPRDHWGFRGDVQFMADRGYAILQPNFRASGGYGKEFLNAGDKEWGKLMQDDITWGVKYLIEQGIADPKRIGIIGGSYGGYATLAGLAFTPDVYACGVDIVGPSNLFTLLESIPPYWEAGRKWLYEMTGDPETEEGRQLIKEASPLFSADKIKAPLMIVQGATDPRVKQAESEQIVAALKNNGQEYTYLLAEDEGHGFRKPINKMAMWAAVEQFFAKHLGGECQDEMSEDVRNTLEKLNVE